MLRAVLLTILLLCVSGCHTGSRFLDNIDNIQNIQQELYRKTSDSVYQVYSELGMGSGWAYSDQYIITNAHVILNFNGELEKESILVKSGKNISFAKVIKWDEDKDIAILKIETGVAIPLVLNTDLPPPGSFVFSFGSPHGIGELMSCGTVLGPTRMLANGEVFFPHSANIAPGSSGGPAVNAQGEVVGMNTLLLGRGRGEYISMAIPALNIYIAIKDMLEDI